MKMLNYYRGNELLTDDQINHLHKVWGESPYHYIHKLPLDENTGTGLMSVTNMLYTIWNTESLYDREQVIIERIKKGVKQSRSRFADKYTSVESNMLIKLFTDAAIMFNESVDNEDKIRTDYTFPYKEIKRLYGLESDSIMHKVIESEKKITDYGTIEYVKYDGIKRIFGKELSSCRDVDSTFHQYYFKLKDSVGSSLSNYRTELINKIHREFPFLAKIGYFSGYGDSNVGGLQINLYDYANTDNNFQIVMNYLIENNLIKLKFDVE